MCQALSRVIHMNSFDLQNNSMEWHSYHPHFSNEGNGSAWGLVTRPGRDSRKVGMPWSDRRQPGFRAHSSAPDRPGSHSFYKPWLIPWSVFRDNKEALHILLRYTPTMASLGQAWLWGSKLNSVQALPAGDSLAVEKGHYIHLRSHFCPSVLMLHSAHTHPHKKWRLIPGGFLYYSFDGSFCVPAGWASVPSYQIKQEPLQRYSVDVHSFYHPLTLAMWVSLRQSVQHLKRGGFCI